MDEPPMRLPWRVYRLLVTDERHKTPGSCSLLVHHTAITVGEKSRQEKSPPKEAFEMPLPRSMMALLAVFALSAKMAESAILAPDVCSEADVGKGFCLNCKEKTKCTTIDSPPDPASECTIAGEACTVLAGIATCRPIAETECSCDNAAQCDAYDPDTVLICLSGGLTVINDCSTNSQTCVDGACGAPLSTTSTLSPGEVCAGAPDGSFVVTKPMCTTAAYCMDGESQGTYDCASGTYFDVAEATCMPVPPVPCAGCGTGACPDKSDCSKWYICDGGVVLDEETCEDPTTDFDIITGACVETGATCTGNDGCTFGLTTITETTAISSDGGSTNDGGSTGAGSDSTGDGSDTTTSGTGATGDSTATTSRPAECTAANEGQRYPYEGNCKMYWSCVKVGNGNYDYVASTCLGEFVFNPATGFCDAPQNVPDCVPPA